MSGLRERLKRINESKKAGIFNKTQNEKVNELVKLEGWESCGFNVLKRTINTSSPLKSIKKFSQELHIFIPDLGYRELPKKEDFLFFDLETTGLSGGAGTVAFLAAFGKLNLNGKLEITQYLLLDYSGQNDFLVNVLEELNKKNEVIVSYNGKCFDSQIIKTMCLMNRIKPPEYWHVDLLHPSRRLWKSLIQDCSQANIENKILGIERIDDIPGSLAPEIWFEFLKTGATEKLIGICEHNVYDIKGLAFILSAIIKIAEKPFVIDKYEYDTERLARSVYTFAYKQMIIGNYKKPLELITKALNVLEPDTLWYDKIKRRKKILERRISRRDTEDAEYRRV